MECPLDKINNVAYSQNIWGRIFGFGTVIIQTAARHGATNYYTVQNPQLLKETITSMQEDYKKSAWREKAATTTIGSELEKLYELKERGILSDNEYDRQKNKILNLKH